MSKKFELPPANVNFPKMEEEILKYWDEIHAFET